MIGLVYYSDDPHQRVFRTVYPSPDEPDSVLDDPKWTTFNVDTSRPRAIDKAANGSGRKSGCPWTPATEPVVYYINYANLTDAQKQTADTFIAANRSWMNFIDLGAGAAATLAQQCVAPCWIVAVDGDPQRGALQRSRSISGHTVGLWTL